MSNKTRILCVDDEELIREVIAELLKDHYEVIGASSGQECLDKLPEVKPSLVLMDVRMPGMDGLETCRWIKFNEKYSSIPVIFVSAQSSLEERIAGYDAGGQEYITKPFDEEELKIKVMRTLETQDRIKSLEAGSKQAQNKEKQAVNAAGEMRVAMEFMHDSFATASFDELGDLILSSVAKYGLEASVHMLSARGDLYYSSKGELDPLEKSVFEYVETHDTIKITGPRTMIRKDKVSLLVSNMPIDEPAKSGRLKAHLNLLMGGANSRFRALEIESGLERQRKVLSTVMDRTNKALVQIINNYQARQAQGSEVLEEMTTELQHTFATMGFETDQEEVIFDKIGAANKRLHQLFEDGEQIDDLFHILTEEIQDALDSKPGLVVV